MHGGIPNAHRITVKMYTRIVVPLDGSAFGKRALPLALALARRGHVAVEFVHVHEPASATPNAPAVDPRFDREQRTLMRTELTTLARALTTETGVDVAARFLDGEVVPSLRQHLAGADAALVVMMTHGRGGLSRFWLGSVADGVIRASPAPVLLLRAGAEWPGELREPLFRRVLIPLDGSALARQVIPHALSLATAGETTLALVSVVDPGLALRATAVDFRLDAATAEPLVECVRRVTEEDLARLAGELRESGAEVTTAVLVDRHPARRILAYAEEREVDLIALSTHGHGSLGRLLLGATADKIVRGAATAVLVYRPGERDAAVAGTEASETADAPTGPGEPAGA